jgi:hypothetical protein
MPRPIRSKKPRKLTRKQQAAEDLGAAYLAARAEGRPFDPTIPYVTDRVTTLEGDDEPGDRLPEVVHGTVDPDDEVIPTRR